jgi:Nitrate reductase gamma subunit
VVKSCRSAVREWASRKTSQNGIAAAIDPTSTTPAAVGPLVCRCDPESGAAVGAGDNRAQRASALWPFTRLVHAFSAPIGYLFRPDVVYRSRDVTAKDELVGLHTRAAGPLHSTTRPAANVGCGRG